MEVDSSTVEHVRLLIREVLSFEVPSDDTDLFESRLIDSLALVSLIAKLEEQFGIRIELDELDLDHFRSVDRIAQFLTATAAAADHGHRSATR